MDDIEIRAAKLEDLDGVLALIQRDSMVPLIAPSPAAAPNTLQLTFVSGLSFGGAWRAQVEAVRSCRSATAFHALAGKAPFSPGRVFVELSLSPCYPPRECAFLLERYVPHAARSRVTLLACVTALPQTFRIASGGVEETQSSLAYFQICR